LQFAFLLISQKSVHRHIYSTRNGIFMQQSIVHIALVVRDYDEAIDFYVTKLGFELIEDTYQAEQGKRWVVVAPPGGVGTTLLLAKASKPISLYTSRQWPRTCAKKSLTFNALPEGLVSLSEIAFTL
jgi:catechol 2,3-dioxygenase-like lactoylglutathione lyase family enzyme